MRHYSRASDKAKVLFLAYILIEITLFILVGKLVGVLTTLGLIILTTIFGLVLLRQQKIALMKHLQKTFQSGQPPQPNTFTNAATVLAGFLLIIPGFFTDLLGLLCLMPKIRATILNFFTKTKIIKPKGKAANDANIIEGEFWHEDDEKKS